MKKSVELKKIVDELKAKVESLQGQELYDDAAKAANDLNAAVRDYQTAVALEAADLSDFQNGAKPATDKRDEKKLLNRAFNKALLGRVLTDEERAILNAAGTPGNVEATPEKGGYLVPEEQLAILREYRRSLVALKSYCNVQTANSNSGKMPTIGAETGKLIAFDEINDIKQDDLTFGQLKYDILTYGDIIPVSNELLQDADIDIMSVIGQRFARKSVNTENGVIIDLLGKLSQTSGKTWKEITKALNVTLDPAISASAKIYTNQDGLEFLDELTDSQGRPLLTASLADPSKYAFRGREIIVVSNTLMTSKTSVVPFYIGSLADHVAFFQRQGVEVAVSNEAGFAKNTTMIRAIERFGVVADDADAIVSLGVSTASA